MPELPEWLPLEEIGEAVSGGNDDGQVVGIVASESAVEAGWAEGAAIQLARAWTASGRKVMLVDGSLQRPSLHVATGLANGEGLSDATLFGASVGRVAQPVEDGDYFVITAGTAIADTNAVVRSRRWDQLAKSAVEAGVTLGIFLRDGESGTAAFLGSASEIVVLAGRSDAPPASVRDLEGLVRLVTGPDGAGEGGAPGSAARPAPGGGDLDDPLSAAALKRTASEGRSRVVFLAVFALVLIVALLAMFGIIDIPWLSPEAAADIGRVGPTTAGPRAG
jgi:hypothetical protein